MSRLPDLSKMCSFADIIESGKKEKAELQKKFDHLKKQYDELYVKSSAVPLKRKSASVGTQTRLKTATVSTQSVWVNVDESIQTDDKSLSQVDSMPETTSTTTNSAVSPTSTLSFGGEDCESTMSAQFAFDSLITPEITAVSNSVSIFGSKFETSKLSFKTVDPEPPSQSFATFAGYKSGSLSTNVPTSEPKPATFLTTSLTKPATYDAVPTNAQKRSNIEQAKFPATTTSVNASFESGTTAVKICETCGYTTEHSGHFNQHKMEGCKSAKPVKDKNCPICCRSYTHNQLRFHLRQYITDSSKAKNGHQNFSPAEHARILEKLKEEKKQNDH